MYRPGSRYWFKPNDVVAYYERHGDPNSILFGVVTGYPKDQNQLTVYYYKNGKWSLLSGTTHYTNLTYIGSLCDFDLDMVAAL